MNAKSLTPAARRQLLAVFPPSRVILFLLLIIWTAAVPPLGAQGTRSDYMRAGELRQRTEGKVFRDRVKAIWLPDQIHFWYRVQTAANTHEFILVDASTGKRQPAFDHARLAKAFIAKGITNVIPNRLPVEIIDLSPDGRSIELRCNRNVWRCNLKDYSLIHQKRDQPTSNSSDLKDIPPATRRTGSETSITFKNHTSGSVQILWLDTEGSRQSYGVLGAGETRTQHTFAGHVWLVADKQGAILSAFEADENQTLAEIDIRIAPLTKREHQDRKPSDRPANSSPDGHWQAQINDNNLWIKNLVNGESFQLSTDGSTTNLYGNHLEWSPDSKKLLVIRTTPVEERKVYLVESSPKDQLQPKLHTLPYAKPGDPLPLDQPILFDIPARIEIRITNTLFSNPWSLSDFRWSPDSSQFTFLYNQRGHQVLRVLSVDAATGQTRTVVDETSRTFIDYSGKFYCHHLAETGELIWMSERDGWNHLYLYDVRSGRIKSQITQGEWVVRGVDRVDEKTRQIWFRAGGVHPGEDPYHVHFCRVNFDGSGMVVLTRGNGTHTIEYSPNRNFFVDTWSRVDCPPVNELRRADTGELVCELERGDWSALLQTGWHPPERFVAKGRDGLTDIFGVIYRPMKLSKSRKYPIIEDIYAGPQDSFTPKSFRPYYPDQSLAELGFIVVKMDGMGTCNRSKKFHDVCWQNLGDSGFPDRILWIKAAAAKYPYMDLRRVGIFGGSAGGQNSTRALLAHGDFYKVAVSDCGCHDNRMDKIWWNEQWMGWPLGPHYAEQSNVTQAHHLQGKLLLIVGELDRNVDPSSTMQVVDALIKADKDFELLVVPGGGHGIGESPYGQRRRKDFFVRNLLGVEPRSKP